MRADEPKITFNYKGAIRTRDIEGESERQQSIVVDYDGRVGIGPIFRREDTVFQGDILAVPAGIDLFVEARRIARLLATQLNLGIAKFYFMRDGDAYAWGNSLDA